MLVSPHSIPAIRVWDFTKFAHEVPPAFAGIVVLVRGSMQICHFNFFRCDADTTVFTFEGTIPLTTNTSKSFRAATSAKHHTILIQEFTESSICALFIPCTCIDRRFSTDIDTMIQEDQYGKSKKRPHHHLLQRCKLCQSFSMNICVEMILEAGSLPARKVSAFFCFFLTAEKVAEISHRTR